MTEGSSTERIYRGLGAAPGIAHAVSFVVNEGEVEVPQYQVPPEKREEEISRFEQGLLETRKQISAIRSEVEEKVGEEEAAIFDAHQLVLEDRALIEDTISEVMNTGFNIEHCFQEVSNRYIEAFTQIDDDYIKERVADIKDVSRRLVCTLLGFDPKTETQTMDPLEDTHILVSHELTPSETALLELRKVRGIVSEVGSRTGHSVIMARSLNIPCVVGIHGLQDELEFGERILIDGSEGVVIVNPSPETIEKYGRMQSELQSIHARYEADKLLESETVDGYAIKLLINVEGMESADILQESGAEGIGLVRTENLFLNSKVFPDEEEQFLIYKNLVDSMHGKMVTIRTLDLGGDKNPHKSLSGYQEANPFMGFRGIRFCLENRDVFLTQLKAILRASHFGRVRVLYPMICCLEELIEANDCLEQAKSELRKQGIPFDERIAKGSMIEVPSAAVITDLLADHCDFFSVGTNDLIQYMVAVDRVNDRIAHLYDANHPAIIRTLSFIFEAGRERGIPVSVCGELAADGPFAAMMIGMGASELSISISMLPEIKYLIRRMTYKEAKKLAMKVLKLSDSQRLKSELTSFYNAVISR